MMKRFITLDDGYLHPWWTWLKFAWSCWDRNKWRWESDGCNGNLRYIIYDHTNKISLQCVIMCFSFRNIYPTYTLSMGNKIFNSPCFNFNFLHFQCGKQVNHTLFSTTTTNKYQLRFILCFKFTASSTVILSPTDRHCLIHLFLIHSRKKSSKFIQQELRVKLNNVAWISSREKSVRMLFFDSFILHSLNLYETYIHSLFKFVSSLVDQSI